MTSNPAATYSRTEALWSFPSGIDVARGRNLVPTNLTGTGTLLDGIVAATFAANSTARLTNPGFLNLQNLSVEFLIRPTTITATGFIFRAGSLATALDVGIGVRLALSAGNIVWSMLKRGSLTAGGANGVVQSSNAGTAVIFGSTYHVVAVAANNLNNAIYINGVPLTLTHTNNNLIDGTLATANTPLFGPIPIDTTYELAIGDPSILAAGFLGILGRVVVYPYAVTAAQAAASYRAQLLQADQVVGLGDESSAGAGNFGPVAVPFIAPGSVAENADIDLDPAAESFDANGTALTVIAGDTPDQGTATVLPTTNRLRYRPFGGTGGDGVFHQVPFRIRDATLQSSSFARVAVTPAATALPVARNDSGFTTAFNTAITIPVTNNDDVNGATISAVSNPANGSATINVAAQTITYSPDAGTSGAASFTYTLLNSAGSSTATVSLTVQAEVVVPTGEIPTALRTVPVTNSTELNQACSNAQAGDHIECRAGSYNGFTLNRTGTQANPIFVTRRGTDLVTITGGITLDGAWCGIHRLRVTSGVTISAGTGHRMTRCLFDNANISASSGATSGGYPRFRIDHNEFRDVVGPVIGLQMERCNLNQNGSIDHNYFNGHTSTSSEHVMQILTDTFREMLLTISDNLFNQCMKNNSTGQTECVGLKVGGVTVMNNTFTNNPSNSTGGEPNISLREARACTVSDNWFENGFFIRAHGDDHIIRNNRAVPNTAKIVDLQTGDAYNTTPDECTNNGKVGQTILVQKGNGCATAHCAIRRAVCNDNDGDVNVGTDADPFLVRDVSGQRNRTVNVTTSRVVSGTISVSQGTPNNTAVKLTTADVGPNSP